MKTFILMFLILRISSSLTDDEPCDMLNSIEYAVPSLIQCLNSVLKLTGIREFLDGTPASTMAPLDFNPIARNQIPSPDKIHFYMYFAGAVNCGRNLPTLTCPFCGNIPNAGYEFGSLIDEPIYNTRAFIAINNVRKELVLSFRGSLNIPNNIEDLRLNLVSVGPGIAAHSGFWATLDNIYNDVVNGIRPFLAMGYKLVVSGHSLGGALASLLVYRIMNEAAFPGTSVELYTYGSPRVGNKAFANYMNGLSIISSRTVDYADIVPHLVPAALGYYHHATEFWIYNTSNLLTSGRYCNRNTYEDPTCSSSRGPLYSLIDHSIYFDVNIYQCIETDPLYHLPQELFNLWVFLPRLLGIVFPEIDLGTGISDSFATLQSLKNG